MPTLSSLFDDLPKRASQRDIGRAIESHGGIVTYDPLRAEQPVTGVDFFSPHEFGDPVTFTEKEIDLVLLCPHLIELELPGLELNGNSIVRLAALERIERLDLSENPIGTGGLDGLRAMRLLRSLKLNTVNINDDDLSCLHKLTCLQYVDLISNSLNGSGFRYLADCVQLRELHVRCNPLTDAGLSTLPCWPELRVLRLGGTRSPRSSVTDQSLAAITRLLELETLDLNDLDITDDAIDTLASLKSLKQLRISDTHVTRDGVDRLKGLRPDLAVGWSERW